MWLPEVGRELGNWICYCCSFAKSCLTLCEPMHPSLLCPSLSLRVCSNSCPLSWWCYLTISYSAASFSSCLQSFPASAFFPMNQFFTSDGQSIRASASASVLPKNTQDWSPLEWTGWISLQSEGLSRGTLTSLLQHHSSKVSILQQPQIWRWYHSNGKK